MPSTADRDHDRPSSVPWPPILLAGALGAGFAVDRWLLPLPVPFAETGTARLLGGALIAAAVALVAWAAVEMRAARTTVRPDRGARALVTTGPFAWSRNPIYVGDVLVLVGVALAANRLAYLLLAPLFVLAVTVLAIRPEERHLGRRFGDDYAAWAARVRRWL